MTIDPVTGELYTFMRTPYNYDTDNASNETALTCEKETKTQQQFKDETDINTIVERFGASGEMPPTMTFPEEQDFTEIYDFQTAMNVMRRAEESFMELPAKARARFQNSPQQFMEFIHNPENQEEAIRLGLATKRPEEIPVKQPDSKEPDKT